MFTTETQGAVDLIVTDVPLNHESVQQLHETVAGLPAEGQPMVVLDMSQVPLVDGAGLESLLDVQDRLRASGGEIKLAGLSPLCEDILRVTGVGQRFELYPNAKAAVGSFVR